jgi:creatinine deaminase
MPSSLPTSTGACILYGISRVVIGENKTFLGGEAYLKQRGIEVVILENKKMQDLMEKFISEKPEVWYVLSIHHRMNNLLSFECRNEDIGEEERVHSKEVK